MKSAIEHPAPTPTAVAYLRTARPRRDPVAAANLERQCDACCAQARKLGVTTPPILYIDEGQSGKSPSRPALDTLFDDLTSGETRYVITTDRARLARDPSLALSLQHRITNTGAELIIIEKSEQ